MESPFKREQSKSSFTDDEELSRMSDLESEYRESSRRMSLASLPASPSASSYNKMSVDSDDARSTSSASGKQSEPRIIRSLGSHWATLSDTKQQQQQNQYNIRQQDELFMLDNNRKSPQIKAYDLRERRDPERRNVNRRSSLLVTKHCFCVLNHS
jgi:hypothetical protein